MASRKRKSNKRATTDEFHIQATMTPLSTPRRSARLTQKYGSGTAYPYYISSRPWLSSYKDATTNSVLNESGQSVPSNFETDATVGSMDDVSHDHTYSRDDNHNYREFVLADSAPLATSSPPLYGLDVSDNEEPEIPSSSDFNIHIKERTLTPRKQAEASEPHLLLRLISFVFLFFYRVGSCLYLLINLAFCCDVSILQKLSQLFRGRYCNRSPVIGLLILFGVFFLLAVLLVVPHVPFSSTPPSIVTSTAPPLTTTVTQTILPSPLSGTDNSEVIEALRQNQVKLREDHESLSKFVKDSISAIHQKLESMMLLESRERKGAIESLRHNESISEIYKTLSDLSTEFNKRFEDMSAIEQQERQKSIENMKQTLHKEIMSIIDERFQSDLKSLEAKLMKVIEGIPVGNTGGLTQTQVQDLAQRLIDDAIEEVKKLISDNVSSINKKRLDELTKLKNSLEGSSIELERKMNDIEAKFNVLSGETIANLRGDLFKVNGTIDEILLKDNAQQQISDELKELKTIVNNLKVAIEILQKTKPSEGGVTEDFVWDAINSALFNYSADQIVRFDFALESAGGRVSDTSKGFDPAGSHPKLFGFTLPIALSRNSPSAVLQPSVLPGDCWCFEGSEGYILVKLASTVVVNAVTIQHIPKALFPNVQSAPKQFKVFGKTSLEDGGKLLGDFEYNLDSSKPIQTFEIINPQNSFNFVQFQFVTNYGNSLYTCIYRVRVHGSLPK